MNPSRRDLLKGVSGGAVGCLLARAGAWAAEEAAPVPMRALRKLAGGRPLIGAAVPSRFEKNLTPGALALLDSQFDSVTPENCMKWQVMCREEGECRFEQPDQLMERARANKQKVVGHCLVFNRKNNYPDWVFRDGEKAAEAKLVWKRVESHIAKVMTRYKGRIHSWDVLNEFVETREPFYRETDFTEALGKEYPARLFKLATELDPGALTTYNDYGLEQPGRREKVFEFVRSLQDRGCRIDVVGSQSHLELGPKIGEEISATIQRFATLGIRCAFTELDVDVVPRGKYWNPKTRPEAIAQNPYVEGVPEEVLKKQAEVYADVFAAVMANRKHVDRVTFWGITDAKTWLNHWPWERVNHPLLFDREAKPKPCFEAVANVLGGGR